jgi:hypothetical protein
MNETAQLREPGARPGRLTAWVRRLQRHLSDRVHAGGDAFADGHGWTITPATGRFGFGARTYHDPRFTRHARMARPTPSRTGPGPGPGPQQSRR